MRTLLLAVAAVLAVSGCDNADPTEKDDVGCTVEAYKSTGYRACSQLHITEAEALIAKLKCEEDLDGTWSSNPCPAEDRVPGGYCKVEASEYNLSGSDAKVYFYSTTPTLADPLLAESACATVDGGQWIEE